jgi:uncharacterized membrane protein YphA (DoxX/SURF4 family)
MTAPDAPGEFVGISAPAEITQLQQERQAPRWSLATRVAFRFCFVYFGLFCLVTEILGSLIPIPRVNIPDLQSLWPIRPVILWVAAHILRIAHPIAYADTGSGDRCFDWIVDLVLLVVAALATVIWSFLDRRRQNYVTLHKWFRLFIRFSLASQMILYGMAKVIPLQMPYPSLTKLLEPFGNFSPMGVLWSSIGSSPAYETFAGCAEMVGGILLIVPRTTTLGALVCLADMTQVFVLNMTYDVPVKLLSFHLLLLALILLAPDLSRLADFFLRIRAAEPSRAPQLFSARRKNRIAFAAQIVLGIWILAANAYGGWSAWHSYGGGRPRSALYGIWDVERLSVDGQLRAPLLTDYGRWRRVIFDFPERMDFQRMDNSFARYGAAIDVDDKTLALTKSGNKNWKAVFHFARPAENQLTLDGDMDGHAIHMDLLLLDRNKSLLVSRGFHWIQESPYNR